MAPSTILFLAANPTDSSRLRLDQEVREIREGLKRAEHRDRFTLEQRSAVQPRTLQRAMLEVKPQIVHFSGHGGGEGLFFEDEGGRSTLVKTAALASLFRLFTQRSPIDCVVLNGCYSVAQAEAIAHYVPHVIGMRQSVGDHAAIEFAVGFYDALGVGETVEFAFESGKVAMELNSTGYEAMPVLVSKASAQANAAEEISLPKRNTPEPIGEVPVHQPSDAVEVTVESRRMEPKQPPTPAIDLSQGPGGERLYRALLNLGYHKQAKFFMQLKRAHDVAALLIYGLPEHGQRWLLNRLVLQFLPELMSGKVATIDLRNVTQRHSAQALWKQFGRQFGLRGSGDSLGSLHSNRTAITQQVHRCLESQDILLVIHGVDSTTESILQELIAEFWLPLIEKLEGERTAGTDKHKLLLFLMDYKGVTESWQVPSFVEKIDLKTRGRLDRPARSPKLEQFSSDELEDWLVSAYSDLPDEVGDSISDEIDSIMAKCDNGIPEMVFEELCDYCGVDWYAVRSRWLRL